MNTWLTRYSNKLDEEIECELDEQRNIILKRIRRIRRQVKTLTPQYSASVIEFIDTKIIPYVKKYKWLPESYDDMLEDYEKMVNLSEGRKT